MFFCSLRVCFSSVTQNICPCLRKKVDLASTNMTTIQALSLEQHRWCKPKDSLKHSGAGTLLELSTEVFLAENIK